MPSVEEVAADDEDEAAAAAAAEERLERYFLKHAKEGITLNAKQLAAYAKKNSIPYKWEELRRYRHKYKFSAYSAQFKRPLRYMSTSIAKYGVVQVRLLSPWPLLLG